MTVWNDSTFEVETGERPPEDGRRLEYRSGLDDARSINWQNVFVGLAAATWGLVNILLGLMLAAFTMDSLLHLHWSAEDLVIPCSAFSTVFFLALAYDAIRSARDAFTGRSPGGDE